MRMARRRACALHRRYAAAFDVGYRDRFGAEPAVHDIERIEEVLHTRAARPQPLPADRGLRVGRFT